MLLYTYCHRPLSLLFALRWMEAHVCAAESVAYAGRCTGCKTQVCWLCGIKLPALNPYSHFTANGCPNVGGGAAHNGGGVPAGAWAKVPVSAASCPAVLSCLTQGLQSACRVERTCSLVDVSL